MALLALNIGPVQTFIAIARTTRDLWCGSYVLSWMTRAALLYLHDSALGGGVIFPVIDPTGTPDTYACLPNLLLANVPEDQAAALAKEVRDAARAAWTRIACDVKKELTGHWTIAPTDFEGWKAQIEGFFDIRATVLADDGRPYAERYTGIGKRVAADKSIRHIEPSEGPNETRPKCFVDGTHAQMGPRGSLKDLAKWWGDHAGEKSMIGGTRVGNAERLSAVSLTKRYAWACSLQAALGAHRNDLRFPDTATIAARLWLDHHVKGWQEYAEKPGQGTPWSGQWLHSDKNELAAPNSKDQDDPGPPHKIEKQIVNARIEADHKPPTYYAALMMDGDKMGDRIRAATKGADDAAAIKQHRNLSEKMAEFAKTDVRNIVDAAKGVLVYSGGDDVLALLPVRNVFQAADRLRCAFACRLQGDGTNIPANMSAGIALAHHKSDLRETLDAARAAERQAKENGRNRLCLAVLKHSGERRRATLTWDALEMFVRLIEHHDEHDADGKKKPQSAMSDRWAYRLGLDATRLCELHASPNVIESETRRMIARGGKANASYETDAVDLWQAVSAGRTGQGAKEFEAAIRDYAFLVRASSFVTRGREER